MASPFEFKSSGSTPKFVQPLLRIWQRITGRSRRILREDTLKNLLSARLEQRACSLESLSGALNLPRDQTAEILTDLARSGLIEWQDGEIALTQTGRKQAIRLLRAHRLWERYLAERTGYSESEWHAKAEAREHDLSQSDVDRLARQLGDPSHDPHGDPIPTASGAVPSELWIPLGALPPGKPARVVHIEDEPNSIAAQLSSAGLYPGLTLEVIEVSTQQIRFAAEGQQGTVPASAAVNVHVRLLLEAPFGQEKPVRRLSELATGEAGRVIRIGPRLRGQERRRLLDLGVLPGTRIVAQMQSPLGDPVAYLIRGALIALRSSQTDQILITEETREADYE